MQKSPQQPFLIVTLLVVTGLIVAWVLKLSAPSDANKPTPAHLPNDTTEKIRDHFELALKQIPPDSQSINLIRSDLLSSSKLEAVAIIRELLASGKDRSTGMEFEIENGGSLKSWPTLRIMLLDLLAEIDPSAAAEIARDILATPTTADEWAVALRNIARFEDSEDTRDFLIKKTEELIRNADWQATPSIGYLNAFDVLVHTKATSSTPLLSGLIQNKDRRDLSHAAFLTLDRLVQRQPVEMLSLLAADTALQQSRPEMTAQQFARADLRNVTQREIVKTWLIDPARTAVELRSFIGVFPNQNQFASPNLLTRDSPPSREQLAAHDQETLEILRSWSSDPAFETIKDHLSAMTTRLEQFTRDATPKP